MTSSMFPPVSVMKPTTRRIAQVEDPRKRPPRLDRYATPHCRRGGGSGARPCLRRVPLAALPGSQAMAQSLPDAYRFEAEWDANGARCAMPAAGANWPVNSSWCFPENAARVLAVVQRPGSRPGRCYNRCHRTTPGCRRQGPYAQQLGKQEEETSHVSTEHGLH